MNTEESDFLMFPRSFSAEFQLSQLAAEETGVTSAYFSSVVPHFNTDVLTFFLCHFLLPPTSALSVVFGANCSIGGSDIKSHCGWLACIKTSSESDLLPKTTQPFVLFFFLKSFFHRLTPMLAKPPRPFPRKCKSKYNPAVPCERLNLLFRRGGALTLAGLHIYCT